jgi:micrococcal nuclease
MIERRAAFWMVLVLLAGCATSGSTASPSTPPTESTTEAPVTEPPATEAPVTEAPPTEPPATEPPVTEPPVTEPPTGAITEVDTTIEYVFDGDTVRVVPVPGALKSRMRLIGLDAPENTTERYGFEQCYGDESAEHLRQLIPISTPIRVVFDKRFVDDFGRSLGYIYRLIDGLFVNVQMVRDGYVDTLRIWPNIAHTDEFNGAVAEAQAAGAGIWGACGGLTPPGSTPG